MDGGGSAGGRGRYEDKGGQQVGSFFAESADNEKIEAIYGDYNFWSWLRYWWIDTENQITLRLLDKGYYDYDYEKPSIKTTAALTAAKSDAELEAKLRGMGFALKSREPMTAEQVQAAVMAAEAKKRAAR